MLGSVSVSEVYFTVNGYIQKRSIFQTEKNSNISVRGRSTNHRIKFDDILICCRVDKTQQRLKISSNFIQWFSYYYGSKNPWYVDWDIILHNINIHSRHLIQFNPAKAHSITQLGTHSFIQSVTHLFNQPGTYKFTQSVTQKCSCFSALNCRTPLLIRNLNIVYDCKVTKKTTSKIREYIYEEGKGEVMRDQNSFPSERLSNVATQHITCSAEEVDI